MLELLIICSILILLLFGITLRQFFLWDFLSLWGMIITLMGLLLGVPSGLYYHRLLYNSLKSKLISLPSFWWISPVKYHAYLSEYEFKTLSPYFKAGALGFFISMGGCFIFFIGIVQ